jgi:membrane fusion protein (multidrug efflux system)
MSTAFNRTIHTLSTDGCRFSLWGVLCLIVLLAIWGLWAIFASLPVYAVTNVARLEVARAVHPVQAPVAGRVIVTHLHLGQEVQARDVLVELETAVQQLQLDEERTRADAVTRQLVSLREEVAIAQRAFSEAGHAARVALDEARAKFREASASARFAGDEVVRSKRLHARDFVAEVDVLRAQAEAQQRQAAADGLQLAISRLHWEHQKQEHDRQAEIIRLTREITRLEDQERTAEASIARLTHEMVRRQILAPVSGRLGEVTNLSVGTFIQEGERIAAVVPTSALKVVADFVPAVVLGRIRPGQSAHVRLDSFPWAQYGTIAATVVNVASEATNGRVRVELIPSPVHTGPIPLQHGLPGMIEIEVERVAPATLILRAAGQLLAAPGAEQKAADTHQESSS